MIATATQAGAADFDLREVAERGRSTRCAACYPQLAASRDRILDLLAREQRDFGRVVRRGLDRLAALATGPGFEITGDEAFTLFATHGMPVDLIRDFAAERGGRWTSRGSPSCSPSTGTCSRGHADACRAPARRGQPAAADPASLAALDPTPTRFLGHQQLTASAEVTPWPGRTGDPPPR